MNNKLLLSVTVIVGLAVGYVTSYIAIVLVRPAGTFKEVGPWRTQTNLAVSQTDWYTRARIARYGTYALPRSEVNYFMSPEDNEGRKITHECVYKIVVPDPPSRWWSITIYRNGLYIPNQYDRYSISTTTVDREPGENVEIILNTDGSGRNALALGERSASFHPIYSILGSFVVSYRLYQPSADFIENATNDQLPIIERVSCIK